MAQIPILPASYMPPVTYLLFLLRHEHIHIEAEETYPKQTLRNRCRIYTANGPMILTVPVSRPSGAATKTKDIRISYRKRWQDHHWKTITAAYNRSPFFFYYKDELEKTLLSRYDTLLELDLAITRKFLDLSGIKTTLGLVPGFEKPMDPQNDPRYGHHFGAGNTDLPSYPQVFSERHGFIPDLSFLDLLCNMGTASKDYLRMLDEKGYAIQGTRS